MTTTNSARHDDRAPYIDAARRRKALAIARYIEDGWTGSREALARCVELATPRERVELARGAGQHPPSGETWAWVVALVRRGPPTQPADPFAGLTEADQAPAWEG